MVKIAQFPESVTASSNAHAAQSSRTVRARKRPSVKHAAADASATAIDVKDEFLSRVLDLLSHHERMALRLRYEITVAANAACLRPLVL